MIRPDAGRWNTNVVRPSWSASRTGSNDPRVVAALEEFLRLCEVGPAPSRTEFLGRYPDIADDLLDCLDGLEFVRRASACLAPLQGASDETIGLPTATRLGDFRILREVGRGGMGVVYEAEQLSLGRRVALKVLPAAASLDPRQLQRFHIEAQAAALLRHEHIVPVFVVGREQSTHFLAMQFVNGWSLADVISQMRGLKATSIDTRGIDSNLSANDAARDSLDESLDTPPCFDPPLSEADDSDRTAIWRQPLSPTPEATAFSVPRILLTPGYTALLPRRRAIWAASGGSSRPCPRRGCAPPRHQTVQSPDR